jgi:predicted nucleic acid-binding protein
MIVVDTNIISYLYITSEKSKLAEQLLLADSQWNAPVLWRSEFRSVLSLYLRKEILTFSDTLSIMQEAESLLLDHEFEVSSHHVMQLVNSSNCSAYDCEFVALAQYLDIPLITADKKILREFPEIAKSPENYL